jgi:hypothetical protein
MGFIVSLVLIAGLAFSAFCFYSGVSSIGEKIKKDGLYSAIEIAVLIFLATALIIMAVGKVNSMLFRPEVQNMVRVIDV